MIHALAWFASTTAIILLLFTSRFGAKYLIAVKGVIDAGWSSISSAGGVKLNTSRVVGALVPLFVLPKLIAKAGPTFFLLPMSKLATLFLISNFWGMAIMISDGGFIGSLIYMLRVLNGYLGFFMFQVYFHERDTFKSLLAVLLIGGLFPMGFGLFGALTGTVFGEAREAAGLMRNIGVYHDAVVIRTYALQTLMGILLFWEYAKPNILKKLFLLAYTGVCVLVIFKAYSKSAFIIFIFWALIWLIFNKKIGLLLLFPVIVIALNFVLDNAIVKDVVQMFSKETAAWTGEMDERFRFSGRTMMWEYHLHHFSQEGLINKLFGTGASPPVHNEYLRLTLANGILGLIVYLLLYVVMGFKVLIRVFRKATPLNVAALMLFTMLSIDNMGVTPGMYPAYQWLVYGFITLSLRGVDNLDERT